MAGEPLALDVQAAQVGEIRPHHLVQQTTAPFQPQASLTTRLRERLGSSAHCSQASMA